MGDAKSTDSFPIDVEDGSGFLTFLGCFVSFFILSDGLSLSSAFFKSLTST